MESIRIFRHSRYWLSGAAASPETQMQLRFEDCDIHSTESSGK